MWRYDTRNIFRYRNKKQDTDGYSASLIEKSVIIRTASGQLFKEVAEILDRRESKIGYKLLKRYI